MKKWEGKKVFLTLSAILLIMISTKSLGAMEQDNSKGKIQPAVVPQIMEEAKKNNNWKTAFLTGEQEQIVFMNISPLTNPNNEIGMEVHAFDQVIIIVEGNGKTVLNGKTSAVKAGDMIFIPKGTSHNVMNLGQDKELKIISFYSQTDIPSGAVYNKKADEPKE